MARRTTIITNSIIAGTLVVLGLFVFNLNLQRTYLTTAAPVYHGTRDTQQLGLMFIVDDTAAANNLPLIMQALTTGGVTATFFISGMTVLNNLDAITEAGTKFELGNYGFTNKRLDVADKNLIQEEITTCGELLTNLTHQKPQYFCPPDFTYNKNTLGIAENCGYQTILPTKRRVAIDWEQADSNLVTAYATTDAKAGDIICLRPTNATIQSLPRIIAYYQERELKLTSLAQLLA